MGFRTPTLTAVPDPISAADHRRDAAGIAEGVRPHLIALAKELEKAYEPLAAHKARSAVLLIDEVREGLSQVEGAA